MLQPKADAPGGSSTPWRQQLRASLAALPPERLRQLRSYACATGASGTSAELQPHPLASPNPSQGTPELATPTPNQGSPALLAASPHPPLLDLASNDYLGLSRHPAVLAAAAAELAASGLGAGASRLVSGTRPVHLAAGGRLARLAGPGAGVALSQWLPGQPRRGRRPGGSPQPGARRSADPPLPAGGGAGQRRPPAALRPQRSGRSGAAPGGRPPRRPPAAACWCSAKASTAWRAPVRRWRSWPPSAPATTRPCWWMRPMPWGCSARAGGAWPMGSLRWRW